MYIAIVIAVVVIDLMIVLYNISQLLCSRRFPKLSRPRVRMKASLCGDFPDMSGERLRSLASGQAAVDIIEHDRHSGGYDQPNEGFAGRSSLTSGSMWNNW
ncbi:MAG: hypothetical protein KDJ97_38480, partial [Anaerolineae bacterium]|nr:hypothetical protein [Anaerolineae bacterium]